MSVGKPGIRGGSDIDRARRWAAHVQFDPVFAGIDMSPGILKLGQHRVEGMPGAALTARTRPPVIAAPTRKVAGLDAVRQHPVVEAMQPLAAFDGNGVAPVAGNLRAHADQALSQVDDLGFLGRILDDCRALGQGGRHQDVLGAGDRDRVEHHPRAAQAVGVGVDVTGFDADRAPRAARPFRCRSTGRAPMAQPPGSDTWASNRRASNGPSTRMEARMVLTRS
jgi:hypothetical protein